MEPSIKRKRSGQDSSLTTVHGATLLVVVAVASGGKCFGETTGKSLRLGALARA